MARLLRPGWLALLLPIASGITFYASWIAIYPGGSVDSCGTNDLPGTGVPSPLFFAPFLVLPAVLVALRARRTRRLLSEQIFFAVVTAALTFGADLLAFLYWFGLHHCGD